MNQDEIVKEKNDNEIEKKKEKPNYFGKVISFLKKVPYKPYILLGILFLFVLIFPSRRPDILSSNNYHRIEKISNLAMLEVYYHNVAYKEEDASGLGKVFGNIGYKKYWIEYDGIVQFGIDAKQVKIGKPNYKNVVKVYIPDATVLGKPTVDKVYDPVTDTGLLTNISAKDKTEAMTISQKNLLESANQDSDVLNLAKERAKKFFQTYIEQAGKEIGKDYKVVFVNNPKSAK